MNSTISMEAHDAITRMKRDVIRMDCKRVLLSPELYQACSDYINNWQHQVEYDNICGRDLDPLVPTGNIFIRGIPAIRSSGLIGMEYALVPSVRTETISQELDA